MSSEIMSGWLLFGRAIAQPGEHEALNLGGLVRVQVALPTPPPPPLFGPCVPSSREERSVVARMVPGSSPGGHPTCGARIGVSPPAFHAGHTGSSPVPRKNFFKKLVRVEPRVSTTHAPLGTTRGAGAPGGGRAGDSRTGSAQAGGCRCAGGRADHSRHLILDPLSQPQPNPLPPPMAVSKTTPHALDNPPGPPPYLSLSSPYSFLIFPYLILPFLALSCLSFPFQSPRCQKSDIPICLNPNHFGQNVPSTKR